MAKDIGTGIKNRVSSIRIRTWTLTISILVVLVFSILVNITTKQKLSVIDFILLCIIQIVTHCLYFPDGEIGGSKNPIFIKNKDAYNEKASEINIKQRMTKLREYCKIEWEERRQRYILTECGALDITLEEFEILKQKSEEEILKLEKYQFTYVNKQNGEEKTKTIYFTKKKRARLYKLIFEELPVQANYPETIMSAVENNGNSAIRDGSVTFKKWAYIKKFAQAILFGAVLAYIGYTLRDGIGFPEIMQILMYFNALFTTAVVSFSSGEICTKVYKSQFYVALVNFIDGFNEWINSSAPKTDEMELEQPQETEPIIEKENE